MGINAELPGQPQRSKLNFKTLPIHSQVIRDKGILSKFGIFWFVNRLVRYIFSVNNLYKFSAVPVKFYSEEDFKSKRQF